MATISDRVNSLIINQIVSDYEAFGSVVDVKIARKFGVSSDSVARRRKKMNIPTETDVWRNKTAKEKEKEKEQENKALAHRILLWIKKQNGIGFNPSPRQTADQFGEAESRIEFLATHYMTPMSIEMWPGEVFQVNNVEKYHISNKVSKSQRRNWNAKRRSSNSITRRLAVQQLAVGNEREKIMAKKQLSLCDAEDYQITLDEMDL